LPLPAGTTGSIGPSIALSIFLVAVLLLPKSKKTRRSLRHLLYGKKPNVYRVIFEIDERRRLVHVLTIRHGAMDEAQQDEL
jgi:mRNA-degrading endonuclease RelE of RelBE toxin-antitoxin system